MSDTTRVTPSTLTPQLDEIERRGTIRGAAGSGYESTKDGLPRNNIVCNDGFELSVIAGLHTYCTPRPGDYGLGPAPVQRTYGGPYMEVEVGFPSARPEPWDGRWAEYAETPDDPEGTVYGYVPVGHVRELIELHGGERNA